MVSLHKLRTVKVSHLWFLIMTIIQDTLVQHDSEFSVKISGSISDWLTWYTLIWYLNYLLCQWRIDRHWITYIAVSILTQASANAVQVWNPSYCESGRMVAPESKIRDDLCKLITQWERLKTLTDFHPGPILPIPMHDADRFAKVHQEWYHESVH